MNMKKHIALSVIAVVLFITGCTSHSHTSAWEYRWITPNRTVFQKELDAAGKDGWDLVSATPDVGGDRMSAVLRRPKK
jgi:hypothetical protein